MKMHAPLLAVKDMDRSKKFYWEVFGLRVVLDLGANVSLTGGLSLQTEESWKEFTGKEVSYCGNDMELYFEADDFDAFAEKLSQIETIAYVHPVKEQSWGQRAVRFYDPDFHIIEVGENMKAVCSRFLSQGMTVEEIAVRMDSPLEAVRDWLK